MELDRGGREGRCTDGGGTVPDDAWLDGVLRSAPVALAVADSHGVLQVVNDACCEMLGLSRAHLLGRSFLDLTHADDVAAHAELHRQLVRAGSGTLQVTTRFDRTDGSRWATVSVSTTAGPTGQTWTVAALHDVTEQRRTEEQLRAAATTDTLTGLPNRRGWEERIAVLTAAPDRSAPLTLAVLDLDRFKSYNDAYGHPAGDLLLQEFAARAVAAVREDDVLARWGGEEFALALPGCDTDGAGTLLEVLAQLVPQGQTFSAGYDVLRADEGVAACWKRVDDLLFHAKRNGRNQAVHGA